MEETNPKRSFMSLPLNSNKSKQPEASQSREDSLGTRSRSCHDDGEIDDEYYSLDNGLGDDWDPNAKLEPLLPLNFTSTMDSVYGAAPSNSSMTSTPACSEMELSQSRLTILSANSDSEDDRSRAETACEEKGLELFFNSFMDLELEGEVTVCQWLSSLRELSNELSAKELFRLFNHIDEERTGFVDSVDFINFLSESSSDDDADDDVSVLRAKLNAAIRGHPFMLNLQ